MALVKCPDCGKMISDLAPTCIECGRPRETKVILTYDDNQIVNKNEDSKSSSKPSNILKIYTISKIKKIMYLLGLIFYITIFGLLAYSVTLDKRGEYNFLIYIAILVIIYVSWFFVSTAYRVEIGDSYIRFYRIIGSVNVSFTIIDSVHHDGAKIIVKYGRKTIKITDIDNVSDFLSTVKSINPQIKIY